MKGKGYTTAEIGKFVENNAMMKSFFARLRKTEAPTAEEEHELFVRYHNGDMSARDEIIERNQRFVFSVAKVYARDTEEIFDYMGEGNEGLIEALDRYDYNSGNRFLTLAVWYIRRAMNYYLISTRDCVIRSNAMKLFKKTDKIAQKFYQENGYYPDNTDMKELLKKEYNIDIKNDQELLNVNITSIDTEIDDDFTVEECSEFSQKTASANEYEIKCEKEDRKLLALHLLNNVPENKREVVKKLYGIGYDREYPIEELSEEYGINKDEMQLIIDDILNGMREQYKRSVI